MCRQDSAIMEDSPSGGLRRTSARPRLANRAYRMASVAETGATFIVKDASGATVYSAPIGADLGKWSTSYPHVYPLDFSQVTAAGTYTVSVTGPAGAASPSFRI